MIAPAATIQSEFAPARAGKAMHELARRLWPLNRSISGPGLRETLKIITEHLPNLRLIEVPSGARVLDWEVPEEWEVREAWIDGPDGERILDFADSNLHLVGYSEAVDCELELDELLPHLHTIPEQPDAIPYVTSYYERTWGFCLADRQRASLKQGRYHARIDARHFAGTITLGELLIPGETAQEVLLSTYCCHPSMANNELSGPALAVFLARWIQSLSRRRYTYRIVFVPEMIGSIAYLDQHLTELRERVIAGFNITCVGDERAWSYLPSRAGNTLADQVALHALKHIAGDFQRYSWLDRGSDESNYCAPGIDLPVASVMRSKYGEYPEYHTSLDDLDQVVTPAGLAGSFSLYQRMIEMLEANCIPRSLVLGEPQLGRRGLYPSLSRKGSTTGVRTLLDLISFSDGKHTLLNIADRLETPFWDLKAILDKLVREKVLSIEALRPPSAADS